jgi:hypothetical protein
VIEVVRWIAQSLVILHSSFCMKLEGLRYISTTRFYLRVEFKSMYTCLFEKVLDLKSRLIKTVFYYLNKKYDNPISTDLSYFKRPLHKIDYRVFFSVSDFL